MRRLLHRGAERKHIFGKNRTIWDALAPTFYSSLGTSLDVLDGEARRQRLLELVGLLQVLDAQRVQVLAAANLELDDVLRLLDLDGCGRKAKERTRWRAGVSSGVIWCV